MNNYYTSEKIINKKINFGFFTKNGGYSTNNFASLNCGYGSGDDKKLVFKNIERAKKLINLNRKKLKTVNQIHSNKVILINKDNINQSYDADGIITQDKNISIAVITADCCPIFIFDNDLSFISCLHAGWRGSYLNIVKEAINKIKKIQPNFKKINVIIGPCLNKNSFQVDENFKNKFIKKSKNYEKFFYKKDKSSKNLFNMRGLIISQILENNITNLEEVNLDTYTNKNSFFSHRRSTHLNLLPAGRMINIIGFNN